MSTSETRMPQEEIVELFKRFQRVQKWAGILSKVERNLLYQSHHRGVTGPGTFSRLAATRAKVSEALGHCCAEFDEFGSSLSGEERSTYQQLRAKLRLNVMLDMFWRNLEGGA